MPDYLITYDLTAGTQIGDAGFLHSMLFGKSFTSRSASRFQRCWRDTP